MQAAWYERRGTAREVLKVGELPTPEPRPGTVRVRIAVSAVNPSDTKGRSGTGAVAGATMPYPRIIPHQDGAGVIDKVGPGVDPARVGERVWLYMAQRDGSAFGTAAEYAVVPAHKAVRLPERASFSDGASLGIPAMTAHYALFAGGPIDGKAVLVQGGAGAVGFYAVQLAKTGGARLVLATVSREEQAAKARSAGADAVINYKTEDVVARVRALAGGDAAIDRIVEVALGVNVAADAAVLARNGVIATYSSDAVREPKVPFGALLQKDAAIHFLLIYEAPQAARDAAARDINALIEAGRLQHQVAKRFPLSEVAAAHEAMESGTLVGKILVDVAKLD